MPRFCLAKWKNCQAKNGSSSHVIAAGVSVTAAAAPAIISSTGTRMKRHGWLTAYERTSRSVQSQPVDATCAEDPANSTQASPRSGAAEPEGANAAKMTNAPAVRATVAHSQRRAGGRSRSAERPQVSASSGCISLPRNRRPHRYPER